MKQQPSPKERLQDGKRRLARSFNNPDALERAIEIIDAALLDHLRSIYSGDRFGTYRMFARLQRDHVIDAAARALIDQMHALRNRSAHAQPMYLTQRYVQQYADLVTKILDSTGQRRGLQFKRAKRKPKRSQSQAYKITGQRPSSTSPARVDMPVYPLTSPSANIPLPATVHYLPSAHDMALLSDLLQLEVGSVEPTYHENTDVAVDDNEFLQRLLFS